jgi:proteic killer suppression protein
MIRSFRHKGLKQFAETGSAAKLSGAMVKRIANILRTLMAATRPEDMNVPGFKFHRLKGTDKDRYSVWVTGNYRITFAWNGNDAVDVDLEDYH